MVLLSPMSLKSGSVCCEVEAGRDVKMMKMKK